MESLKFQVSGMQCPVCQSHVQKAASGVAGVASATVDLAKGLLTVEMADGTDCVAVASAVIAAVKKLGFDASQA